MKKILLFATAFGLSTSLFAASCNYSVASSSLEWTAFKTPAKVGVKGSFDDIDLKFQVADTQTKLLSSSSVNIVTAKVNSHNEGRDAKLVASFFHVQGVKDIGAKVLEVSDNTANVEISMNGIKKIIPMTLTIKDDNIKLLGEIDLAEFDMLPSLAAITKACYDLHQGKTWQEVVLEFNIKTTCQ